MARRDGTFLTTQYSRRDSFPPPEGEAGIRTLPLADTCPRGYGIFSRMLNVYETFTGRPWKVSG